MSSELDKVVSKTLVNLTCDVSDKFEILKNEMPFSNRSYNEEQLNELEKAINDLRYFVSGM